MNLGLSVNRAESEDIKSEHEPDGLRLWAVRKKEPMDDVKK